MRKLSCSYKLPRIETAECLNLGHHAPRFFPPSATSIDGRSLPDNLLCQGLPESAGEARRLFSTAMSELYAARDLGGLGRMARIRTIVRATQWKTKKKWPQASKTSLGLYTCADANTHCEMRYPKTNVCSNVCPLRCERIKRTGPTCILSREAMKIIRGNGHEGESHLRVQSGARETKGKRSSWT
jgi:hypothetical protein